MTEELDILKIVAENPGISQRKIAEQTGISLGQVNFLIKKCVRKGLVKIEGQTRKSIKYNLTPKGMREKASKTLAYIKISYGAVLALTRKIESLAKYYEAMGKEICICGEDDEMMGICRLALGNSVNYVSSNAELNLKRKGCVFFFWEQEFIQTKFGVIEEKVN